MAGELKIVPGEGELIALITCPDEPSACELSDALVESGAAACVNSLPGIKSTYRWKGEICRDSEWLLVVKTDLKHRDAVASCVTRHHPYDEPELIFLSIESGSRTYLEWINQQLG